MASRSAGPTPGWVEAVWLSVQPMSDSATTAPSHQPERLMPPLSRAGPVLASRPLHPFRMRSLVNRKKSGIPAETDRRSSRDRTDTRTPKLCSALRLRQSAPAVSRRCHRVRWGATASGDGAGRRVRMGLIRGQGNHWLPPAVALPCGGTGGRGPASSESRGAVRGKSGLCRARCRVTPGRREATESVTESRPPMAASAAQARVKRWGKSPPRRWRQRRHDKPHREQGQIGSERWPAAIELRVGR